MSQGPAAAQQGGYVYAHQQQGYAANEQLMYRAQPPHQAATPAPQPQQQQQQAPALPLQQQQQPQQQYQQPVPVAQRPYDPSLAEPLAGMAQQPPSQQQAAPGYQPRQQPAPAPPPTQPLLATQNPAQQPYGANERHDSDARQGSDPVARRTGSTVLPDPARTATGPGKVYKVTPRQAGCVVLGAIFVLVATFTGLGVWMSANMFKYTKDEVKKEYNHVDFEPINTGFLVVYFIFAPWFLGVLLIAGNAISSASSPGKTRRVMALLLAFVSLVVGFIALALWAHPVADCFFFWCLDPSVRPEPEADRNYGHGDSFRNLNGTMILFGSLGFCFALLRVAFAETFDGCARKLSCLYRDSQKTDWFIALIGLAIIGCMWVGTMYLPNNIASHYTPWDMAADAAKPYLCNNGKPAHLCPEMPDAGLRTSAARVNDYTVFRLYPANLFFYLYLILMVIGGVIINATQAYRGFAQRRRFYILGRVFYVTAASVAGWFLTLAMLAVFAAYWFHDHNYRLVVYNTSPYQRAARGFGQLAVAFMSLQMFPIARTSVVHRILGTTPEHFLYAHRVLGYGTLAATICHVAFWFRDYQKRDVDIGVLTNPPYVAYDGYLSSFDNYTIPVQTILGFLLLFVMTFFALPPVRRRAWELFKYTHLVAAYAIIPSTLYHAAASWMYLMPGLTVYIVDRLLRISRSSRVVPKATVTAVGSEYVRLEFTGGLVAHRAGQYAYINVPAISLLQWHPFTISSGPGADSTVMHIKSMGAGTWTGDLRAIAESGSGDEVTVELFVDGPVGVSNLCLSSDYDSVTLVAGGIGITPCAAIVADLLKDGAVLDRDLDKPAPKVSLLWVVKDGQDLADSLSLPTARNASDTDYATGISTFQVSAFETRPTTDHTSAGWARSRTQGWTFQQGRPDVWKELDALIPAESKKPIVFCCGPDTLVKESVLAAQKLRKGILVHTETFEL